MGSENTRLGGGGPGKTPCLLLLLLCPRMLHWGPCKQSHSLPLSPILPLLHLQSPQIQSSEPLPAARSWVSSWPSQGPSSNQREPKAHSTLTSQICMVPVLAISCGQLPLKASPLFRAGLIHLEQHILDNEFASSLPDTDQYWWASQRGG